MKKFSIASLSEIFRKNKSRAAVYALLLMIVAASSIFFCEKKISALEKKWRSLYKFKEVWGYEDNKGVDGDLPRDLKQYDIKVSLTRLSKHRIEIRFCDKYSFILTGDNWPSGVYYKEGKGPEKYVSIAEYPLPSLLRVSAAQQRTPAQQRLEDFHLRLKCDLVEKTVLVYIDGKLMEKIRLGPEPLKYSFGLVLPSGRKSAMLNRLEISDPQGRVLCDVNFAPLIFYKRLSQAFLILGAVLIFPSLACFASLLFRKTLLFVRSMFFPMLLLLLMVAAFFSIMLCQKEISELDRKWRSFYMLLGGWGQANNKPGAESPSFNPTRYDIKVGLTRLFDNDFNIYSVRIRFCDQYSFIWSGESPLSGVYNVAQGWKKYVSTVEYPHMRQERGCGRSKHLDLRVKCDLTEKTALVYVNGKFMEKIFLGPEPLHYSVGVIAKPSFKNITLEKLEISSAKGWVLCNINFTPLFFYKRISQALLILGTLIFLVLACSEKHFFRRALLFMILLVFLEAFLRMAYSRNPNLDISQMKPKWRFEVATNFYGAFNDPKKLTVKPYFFPSLVPPKIYAIANPEHAIRIICFGSSPLLGSSPGEGATFLPGEQAFPVLLETMINPSGQTKNRVIPLIMPLSGDINGPVASTFLYEVASRLNPDLILVYGEFLPTEQVDHGGSLKKTGIVSDGGSLIEEYILYDKAKKLAEKNSDWIKNDRLLYAALEFKEPVKEIVYLYDVLCNSYLFMAMENIRKKVLSKWLSAYGKRPADQELLAEKPGSFFEKVLKLCREKKIKLVFILRLDFSTLSEFTMPEKTRAVIREKYPEIYFLSLKNVFSRKENFLLGKDSSHPSGYGHQVIAEELFRQLTEKGLLNSHKAIE